MIWAGQNHMQGTNRERWQELCQEIMHEQNPHRLLRLIQELTEELDMRHQVKVQRIEARGESA